MCVIIKIEDCDISCKCLTSSLAFHGSTFFFMAAGRAPSGGKHSVLAKETVFIYWIFVFFFFVLLRKKIPKYLAVFSIKV